MTFLELVVKYCKKAGIGPGPGSVIGQSGAYQDAIEDIQTAYEEIQGIHPDWQYLKREVSFSASVMPPVVSNFQSWVEDSFRIYNTALGVSDEQWLFFMPWEQYRDTFYFSTSRTLTGRPNTVTIKPDQGLLVYPIADDAYTIVCDIYRSPYTFSANSDTPCFPQYHMAIVWKALMYYGATASEPDKYAFGQEQFNKISAKLFNQQRPRLMWGPPLA
jgi:hypothetical protein